MKWYENGDMWHMIKGDLNFVTRVCLLLQVAHILEQFAKLKLVHRDINPKNVLIDKHYGCVVSDMSFTKHMIHEPTTFVGTKNYVDPSIGKGNAATHASDLFSFGVVMQNLLEPCGKIAQPILNLSKQFAAEEPNERGSIEQFCNMVIPEIKEALLNRKVSIGTPEFFALLQITRFDNSYLHLNFCEKLKEYYETIYAHPFHARIHFADGDTILLQPSTITVTIGSGTNSKQAIMSELFHILCLVPAKQGILKIQNQSEDTLCQFISLMVTSLATLVCINISLGSSTLLANLLGKCTHLTNLSVTHTPMTVYAMEQISTNLSLCKQIQDINLSHCHLNDQSVSFLASVVQAATKLKSIDLGYNQLTHECIKHIVHKDTCKQVTFLNLEHNMVSTEASSAVPMLFKYWNNLETLNVSNNFAASPLFLSALKDATTLTSLDISHTVIDSDGTKALAPALAQLWNLKNVQMSNIEVIPSGLDLLLASLKDCLQIQYFDISGNAFASVESLVFALKKWKHLQVLNMSCCSIGPQIMHEIAIALNECYNLKSINLFNNAIRDEGMKYLSSWKSCSNLTSLNVERNMLKVDAISHLSSLLARAPKCSHVNIAHNLFGDEGIGTLLLGIAKCKSMKSLNISSNMLSDAGICMLCIDLTACNELQKLCINNNSISQQGAKAIGEALVYWPNLQELHMNSNKLKEQDVELIFANVQSQLQVLHLSHGNIDHISASLLTNLIVSWSNLVDLNVSDSAMGYSMVALFGAMQSCKQLKRLNVTGTALKDEGTAALTKLLSQLPAMEELIMDNNGISDQSMQVLCLVALPKLYNLTCLSACNNYIGGKAATALGEALKYCKKLQSLKLNDNKIGVLGCKALTQELQYCNDMQILELRYNSLGAEGMQYFASMDGCYHLQTLDLSYNSLENNGTQTLAVCLKNWKKLVHLNLEGNSIWPSSFEILVKELQACKLLQTVNLSSNQLSDECIAAILSWSKLAKQMRVLNVQKNSFDDVALQAFVTITKIQYK